VFENRVLGGIFGPKSDEVTGEWRKIHNEELYNLYKFTRNYQDEIKEMRCAGSEAHGVTRNAHKILV
jgi:hypothetical protein